MPPFGGASVASPSMRRLQTGLLASTLLLLTVVGLGSCTKGSSSAAPKNCLKAAGADVKLVASNVAWNAPCIDARPGKVRFTVDNKDDVQHNLHVTGNGVNDKTKLQNGPVTQQLAVTLQAGTYTFVCDIHAKMEGKLYVK